MAEKPTQTMGDPTPVTGGIALPAHLISTPDLDDTAPDDDLGRQAYWLLKLHPDAVSPKFRLSELSAMDDTAKRFLIADIQFALGVTPLKGQAGQVKRYRNLSGDSGVIAYEIGADFIQVQFVDGIVYRYSYASAGSQNVERMKDLASSGKGLGTFLSRTVREAYACQEH